MGEFSSDIQVRFRDIDAMGHVNNAVYATYVEQARTEYFAEVLDEGLDAVPSVLASLELSYERPILLDQSVTVGIDVPEMGRSSLPMTYEVLADGERAATAKSVQVFLDPETEKPHPIPERFRERIAAFEGL
ncbi:thioesterase family protein [Halalkalicoccus sp. NIPERK01]|uniref:acyl-CoA thioesterase n=1 Tax=Halalkalicoccus sp. NIPERK01 TaxID=3053469 RepID=UPI00256F0AF2|nr:thioesterase family protein [Halalkalicoccus sp. NIPERK01]MDL5361698.1 thioesterase family protein [Halalkalicoccus sp. NIPERK01]